MADRARPARESAGLTAGRLALLDAWGLGPVISAAAPAAGTVNETLLLATPTGDYALRAYRHRDRAPVAREHAVIAYVRARGLPAVAPLTLPTGDTILERDGRCYALFPHAPGRQLDQPDLGPAEATAMGAFLGLLHRALADFPPGRVPRRQFAFDRAATLAGSARLTDAIGRRPDRDAVDDDALAWLAGQRAWVARGPATARADFAPLPEQVIHGDYQQTNLFFQGGWVSAIIDWDQTYVAPRAWEVVRALHLVFALAPDPCRRFVAAYRAVLPLPTPDLDRTAASYALKVAHDLWLFEALYLQGNDRVRPFIPRGGFVLLADRWAALRPALSG